MTIKEKCCSKCSVVLDSETKTRLGHRSYCDACSRAYAKAYRKEYYAKNKEKVIEYQLKRYHDSKKKESA